MASQTSNVNNHITKSPTTSSTLAPETERLMVELNDLARIFLALRTTAPEHRYPNVTLCYYDLHLHPGLQLKEIVFLPELPGNLLKKLDKRLEKMGRNPVCPDDFPPKGKPMFTNDEFEVRARYIGEAGRFANVVASDVLFDTRSGKYDEKGGLVLVKNDNDASDKGSGAGAHLVVQQSPTLPPINRRTATRLIEHDQEEILTLQFYDVNSQEAMRDIAQLGGIFDWEINDPATDLFRGASDVQRPTWARGDMRKGFDTAKKMIQKLWASAVKSDSTFMILSDGNHEYIGRRHRASRKLYLSPMIDVCTYPMYGKLVAALYVAAYDDADKRVEVLEEWAEMSPEDQMKELPETYTFSEYEGNRERVGPVARKERREAFQREFESAQSISVSLGVPFTTNSKPMIYHKASSPGEVLPEAPEAPTLKLTMDPILKNRGKAVPVIASRLDGSGDTFHENLIFKCARYQPDIEELQREYERYEELKAAGFKHIPKVYGLFKVVKCDRVYWAILMSCPGKSLFDMESDVVDKYDAVVKNALVDLHGRNFVHKRIDLTHILINPANGFVTFLSCSAVEQTIDEKEKNRELKVWSNFAKR